MVVVGSARLFEFRGESPHLVCEVSHLLINVPDRDYEATFVVWAYGATHLTLKSDPG